MRIFVQLDSNVVSGYLEAVAAPTQFPADRAFVEVPGADLPALGSTYDPKTGTFTPPVEVARTKYLSKADVIGALSPAIWSEVNKFNPTAEGTHAGGTAYNDPEVFWAVSVFNSAAKDFAANDPRIAGLLGRFVTKNIITLQERDTLLATLAAVAR